MHKVAEWDAAYINDLPDSAFAYIEGGGEKDEGGRTIPRSLRHFPHHNSTGSPDEAHVRNALARIPQSDVSAEGKAKALAHVQAHADKMDIGDQQNSHAFYERRAFPFQIERQGDGSLARIRGHAAVFDSDSEEMGWFMPFRERIARGAFDDALERVISGRDDVYALLNHDESYIIASTPGKTLDLSIDDRGLVADMQPKDTQTIRDLVVRPILDGDIRKMSFGFTVAEDHEETRDGISYRIIDKIGRLFDVSPVTFPAYPETDIYARNLCHRLGIDPSRFSIREGLALRSLAESLCNKSSLDFSDIHTTERKAVSVVAAGNALAGVSAPTRLRLLELQERDFLFRMKERN